MYYFVLVFILWGVFKEIKTNRIDPLVFHIAFFILFCMACLRFGQGSDYTGYNGIYNEIRWEMGSTGRFPKHLNTDIGYGVLNYLSIKMDISYRWFMGIVTAAIMLMFYVFLKRDCKGSMLSILFFFVFTYMIYVLSATRQGLAMSFFFCFIYPYLKRDGLTVRELIIYEALVLFIATFHLSALIFFIFPFVKKIKLQPVWFLLLFLFLSLIIVLKVNLLSFILLDVAQSRVDVYVREGSSNQILAIVVRFLIVLPFVLLQKDELNTDEGFCQERIFLFLGFALYAFTSFSELTAGRLWAYFYPFFYLLVNRLNLDFSAYRQIKLYLSLYIMFSCVMWIKDINGFIKQGKYANCTVVTYPYISVFEGEATLLHYRKSFRAKEFTD